ncbi:MAG: GlsB/YeaQ/YmgE family stress response membrane protein [Actinomycetota bacterium]
MLILGIIVFGMAIGWIAQLLLGQASRGRQNDWWEALVAGLLGSFVGGLLASLISGDGLNFRPSGVIGSIAGAVLVLLVWGAVRGKST